MGSLLSSVRGVTALLWLNPLLMLKGQLNYLDLNADGTADALPEIETVPVGLERLIYTKIGLALRKHCILYEFPYDWRKSIGYNAGLLATALEKWAGGNSRRQFTLVGHSMGGLVARAFLATHPEAAGGLVKRVITHGTPYYGAAGTVENLALGNRDLKLAAQINSGNAPRQLLFNLPGVYEVLPAPPELFPKGRPYPINWDIYRAADWQIPEIRQDYLDRARSLYALLVGADPQCPLTQIAGCNVETVVEIWRSFSGDQPNFDLVRSDEGRDAGDGTVPQWSATPPGAEVYYVEEVHRTLPTNPLVIQATLELIEGAAPDLPVDLPPRKAGWFGRDLPLRPEVQAEQLRQRIEAGAASEADLSALYFAM
jgi:pimeloyl-ACP methyl ester carboxylesterase